MYSAGNVIRFPLANRHVRVERQQPPLLQSPDRDSERRLKRLVFTLWLASLFLLLNALTVVFLG